MIYVEERLKVKDRTAATVMDGTLGKAVTLFQLLIQVLFRAVNGSSRADLETCMTALNIRQYIFEASKSLRPSSI